MIEGKGSKIPSSQSMFYCTALYRALLQWQKNNRVHPNASKSKLTADWPDRLNYLNYKNASGKNSSCCAAMGRKLLTSPGLADTYTFWTNTWNTLPESCQQRVYENTFAAVKRQIQLIENPTPAMVISVEAARVDNAIIHDYLTSKLALEEPEIASTDPNIPIENNCMDDKLHVEMPGGSGDSENIGDKSDECDAIPTASRQRQAMTELTRFDLWTSNLERYMGDDGNEADADEEEEAFEANDVSMHNVEDWEQSTRECEDWTLYFRPVKYNNGKANAIASYVSEAKIVL